MRFYLMEFAGTGADLYPTGRIVVFSNAVLFQATTPLFKQLPGTRYTWHEAVIPLSAKADYELVEGALHAAVSPRLQGIQFGYAVGTGEILIRRISRLIHRRRNTGCDIADSGPELVARYPVDLNGHAAEIDDKISKALMDAIHGNEELASAVAGSLKIRAAVKEGRRAATPVRRFRFARHGCGIQRKWLYRVLPRVLRKSVHGNPAADTAALMYLGTRRGAHTSVQEWVQIQT